MAHTVQSADALIKRLLQENGQAPHKPQEVQAVSVRVDASDNISESFREQRHAGYISIEDQQDQSKLEAQLLRIPHPNHPEDRR